MTDNRIDAQRIPIQWHADMPVFAKEPFLKAVGDEYGWLGGIDAAGSLRCILPYTIVRKAGVRMVRFRMETLPCSTDFGIVEEQAFLDSVVEYFRRGRADVIIPPSTNTIFRTYPAGAVAAPYATYAVDLSVSEEALWSAVSATHRRHIKAAAKSGVVVRADAGQLPVCHAIIRDTFRKSSMPFMGLEALSRMVDGLGEDVRLIVAESNGAVHSCAIMPFSQHTAYYVYGGSRPDAAPGSMHLLHWEAMRQFKELGVGRYDFCGARVNPVSGSKAAGLAAFKERFGAGLRTGLHVEARAQAGSIGGLLARRSLVPRRRYRRP